MYAVQMGTVKTHIFVPHFKGTIQCLYFCGSIRFIQFNKLHGLPSLNVYEANESHKTCDYQPGSSLKTS